MSKIVVVMMVKNEEHVIGRAIKSLKYVADKVVITDTGSVDMTKVIAGLMCSDMGIPFKIYDEPWVNFGHNRTKLLEYAAAEPEDYVLMLDADEIVDYYPVDRIANQEFRGRLVAPAYNIPMWSGGIAYRLPRLTKNKMGFTYVGETHEFLDLGLNYGYDLDGINIRQLNDSTRRREGKKFEEDAKILELALLKDPKNTRNQFYLAQTYKDLGFDDLAIEAYKKRVEMDGGWDEEVFYSLYQIGKLYLKKGDRRHAFRFFERAMWVSNFNRAEPLAALLQAIPQPTHGLFIEPDAYVKKQKI